MIDNEEINDLWKTIEFQVGGLGTNYGEKTDMITMMCNQEDNTPLVKRYINEIY